MDFDAALAIVLCWEGGYSDDPDDKGGATKYGITIGTLEAWRKRPLTPEDVRALTLDEAKAIYRTRFWEPLRCGDMPPGLALMLFDGGVNHGPTRAARLLQEALSVAADGKVGPITLAAAQAASGTHALDEYCARRACLYARLNPKFHLGWFRRLAEIHRQALATAR